MHLLDAVRRGMTLGIRTLWSDDGSSQKPINRRIVARTNAATAPFAS